MAESDPTERQRLIAELRQLQAVMRPTKMQSVGPLMDLNLTLPQLKVLLLLAESESMSMGQMAQDLGITLPASTHLMNRLVRAGFVARSDDPADRRVVRCALTDKGRAVVDRLRQSLPFQRPEFLDRLTLDELKVIIQSMTIFKRVMAELQAQNPLSLRSEPPGGLR